MMRSVRMHLITVPNLVLHYCYCSHDNDLRGGGGGVDMIGYTAVTCSSRLAVERRTRTQILCRRVDGKRISTMSLMPVRLVSTPRKNGTVRVDRNFLVRGPLGNGTLDRAIGALQAVCERPSRWSADHWRQRSRQRKSVCRRRGRKRTLQSF